MRTVHRGALYLPLSEPQPIACGTAMKNRLAAAPPSSVDPAAVAKALGCAPGDVEGMKAAFSKMIDAMSAAPTGPRFGEGQGAPVATRAQVAGLAAGLKKSQLRARARKAGVR